MLSMTSSITTPLILFLGVADHSPFIFDYPHDDYLIAHEAHLNTCGAQFMCDFAI